MLPSVTVGPTAAHHSATVIFLHGLGDTGHGWAPVMKILARSLPFVKFILPHAPSRPVTLNYGMAMPAWFDIVTLEEGDDRQDQAGLFHTRKAIEEIVEGERKGGIPAERIILGGFSQGGAVSLLTGLTSSIRLGGILCCSGYLPLHKTFTTIFNPANKDIPVFMGHGTADMVVRYKWGQDSARWIREEAGCSRVTFKSYSNMDHSCNNLEIEDIREFLESILCNGADQSKETL